MRFLKSCWLTTCTSMATVLPSSRFAKEVEPRELDPLAGLHELGVDELNRGKTRLRLREEGVVDEIQQQMPVFEPSEKVLEEPVVQPVDPCSVDLQNGPVRHSITPSLQSPGFKSR